LSKSKSFHGSYLEAKNADEHILGFVLVNDWSARDTHLYCKKPWTGVTTTSGFFAWAIVKIPFEPIARASSNQVIY
jgi:2-keto-4-pentenoate hydratase/2-oxohepta-3-ene-1,7-dioic acid hydratase in catechol pathway